MKQLLVLLFLVSSMACFGQNKDALKDISSVTFYGIDFTRAKVYGAKEGPMQFKYTFDDINKLFITEPKKYDIGKRLGVNVEVTSLEAVNDANKTINPDEIMTTNSGYTLDEKQIEEVIKTLPILSQEEKTGLIMIAMLLNKADARATYQIVSLPLLPPLPASAANVKAPVCTLLPTVSCSSASPPLPPLPVITSL